MKKLNDFNRGVQITPICNSNTNSKSIIKIYEEHLLRNPKEKVLDVGGGDQPIRNATHVIDIQPFPENNKFRHGMIGQHTVEPKFSKDTWTVQDICTYPWRNTKGEPFKDNEFDFIWCTQVLEDIRDPIGACKEMMRIGKKGYVNCPSKYVELMRPINQYHGADLYNGYWHHRWLVSINAKDEILFEQKTAFAFLMDFSDYQDLFEKRKGINIVSFTWEDDFNIKEKVYLSSKENVNSLIQYMEDLKKSVENDMVIKK